MPKKLECPECDAVFTDGRGFQGHVRMSHQITGEELHEIVDRELSKAEERSKVQNLSVGSNAVEGIVESAKEVAMHHGMSPTDVIQEIRGPNDESPFGDLDDGRLLGGMIGGIPEELGDLLDEVENRLEAEKEEAGDEMIGAIQTVIDRQT